jgi:hypothetical protein
MVVHELLEILDLDLGRVKRHCLRVPRSLFVPDHTSSRAAWIVNPELTLAVSKARLEPMRLS